MILVDYFHIWLTFGLLLMERITGNSTWRFIFRDRFHILRQGYWSHMSGLMFNWLKKWIFIGIWGIFDWLTTFKGRHCLEFCSQPFWIQKVINRLLNKIILYFKFGCFQTFNWRGRSKWWLLRHIYKKVVIKIWAFRVRIILWKCRSLTYWSRYLFGFMEQFLFKCTLSWLTNSLINLVHLL